MTDPRTEPDYPEPIDDTPENIARSLFNTPRRDNANPTDPQDGYSRP